MIRPDEGSGSRSAMTRGHVLALVLIVSAGFAVRLAYLLHASSTPGFTWADPDGYMAQALRLANGGAGWQWTFEAVTYGYNHQVYVLPPLYTAFLSVFALFPNFPFTVQIAQVVLNTAAILFVFYVGRLVHSPVAGLVSAGGYAAWIPNIVSVWSTSQENLYIPLVLLGFVVLGRAMQSRSLIAFGTAGVVLGLASLTRSMPLFFVPPAAMLHVFLSADRRRAMREGSMLIGGVALIVVPYCIPLSQYFKEVIIVDSHGSVMLLPGVRAGHGQTMTAIARDIVGDPVAFLGGIFDRARSLLHVNGGRILQIYVVAASEAEAAVWKALVHAGTDGLLISSTFLSSIGAAVSRNRALAVQVLLWTIVNILIASVGGFSGARLRAPFEPLLIVLAAVCVSGGWRRPNPAALAAGTLAGVLAAVAIVPQIPRSFAARADYGVEWTSILSRKEGKFTGRAGFAFSAGEDGVTFSLASADAAPFRLQVRVDGTPVQVIEIAPGEVRTVQIDTPAVGHVYIELEPAEPREAYPTLQLRR